MAAPFHVGFLLFDRVTQLDFTGPLQVFNRLPGAVLHLAAREVRPIATDCGPFVLPSVSLADCPPLDLLCVPGGFGVDDAIRDRETLEFVRRQAKHARYLTSVCTGAFVLGAAGLLEGRRATTHWSYHADLSRVGAIPTPGRVVRDGNVFTGGGVTAGLDFAFTVVAEIVGQQYAEALQLGLEYDPAPPFDSGTPAKADPDVVARNLERYTPRIDAFRQALTEVPALD